MKLEEFDYELPPGRIAQRPLAQRSESRLLLLDRRRASWEDRMFRELPEILGGGELLVVNNTRVFPARLLGRRVGVHAEAPGRHGKVRREFLTSPMEVLLVREVEPLVWDALVRPGRKMRTGERVVFGEGEMEAEVIGRREYGERRLRFACAGDFREVIERLGHVPLPPYIDRPDTPEDHQRYQTIFAKESGAVAAPTAGLHFDEPTRERIRNKGVEICEITLHVGLGTFQPIHTETIEHHKMHSERYAIPPESAERIRIAKREGRPVVAVGTTVVRALEDSAAKHGELRPGAADADIFIYPGHKFRVVDQLLTNFHLPRSSLLVLVSAFAGTELILRAYCHAVDAGYRFYSYGDCMLVR